MRLSQKLTKIIAILALLYSCGSEDHKIKNIVYINSYHLGHPPTDGITAGVLESFPADSFQVHAFFMDTKRNPSRDFIERRSSEILDSIKHIEPDIVVASDDNAIKYLVEPFHNEIRSPVVYCGVNWSADQYNLPDKQITGIIEILPVAELLQIMKAQYPGMNKMVVLNENTTTSRKTKVLLDTLFLRFKMAAEHILVDDFNSWKTAFSESNQQYDIIYLQTNGAIRNWDRNEALRFVNKHIKVPVVTCEEFMMPYAVFGLTQISREQGLLAATMAKKILEGTSPSEIPVSRNHMFTTWINQGLAERILFQPDTLLLNSARIIN